MLINLPVFYLISGRQPKCIYNLPVVLFISPRKKKKIQNTVKKDKHKKTRKEESKQERNSILIINPFKVTFSHG